MGKGVNILVTAWPCSEARLSHLGECLDSLSGVVGIPHKLIVSCETEGVSGSAQEYVRRQCKHYGATVLWRAGAANLGFHLDDLFSRMRNHRAFLYVQEDFVLSGELDLKEGIAALKDYVQIQYAMGPPVLKGKGFVALPDDHDRRFSHRPYLARGDMWEKYGPFGGGKGPRGRGQEGQMNDKWIAEGVPVAAHLPVKFRHIGKESLIRPGKEWA